VRMVNCFELRIKLREVTPDLFVVSSVSLSWSLSLSLHVFHSLALALGHAPHRHWCWSPIRHVWGYGWKVVGTGMGTWTLMVMRWHSMHESRSESGSGSTVRRGVKVTRRKETSVDIYKLISSLERVLEGASIGVRNVRWIGVHALPLLLSRYLSPIRCLLLLLLLLQEAHWHLFSEEKVLRMSNMLLLLLLLEVVWSLSMPLSLTLTKTMAGSCHLVQARARRPHIPHWPWPLSHPHCYPGSWEILPWPWPWPWT
jgi:hypothetical protein